MVRSKNKIDILRFKDIDIQQILDKAIEIAGIPRTIITDEEKITCDKDCELPSYEIKVRKKPRKGVLIHKAIFLIDIILRHCKANKENKTQLHTTMLQKLLGSEYTLILGALEQLNLISIGSTYIIGKQCRIISVLNWDIENVTIPNIKVMAYYKEWKKLLLKHKQQYANGFDVNIKFVDGEVKIEKNVETMEVSEDDKSFYEEYEGCLSMLRLNCDKNDALKYIDGLFSCHNCHRYHYYVNAVESFNVDNMKIISVDKQNRIYHYLTSLPKQLKPLFNIKYELDIANSHPLLFCKYLINHYNINNTILNTIYNINKEEYINNNHNVIKLLCNKLNISNIDVPCDVLSYIYSCSKGIFWDEFSEISGIERDMVKKDFFQHVFYPHKNIAPHTEMGRRFISTFPNVYRTIAELKEKVNLPLMMMRFESTLIRRILKRCYENGIKALNIHDAIIVLDKETNADTVLKTIINVYNEVGLSPTIHYEKFDG